MERMTEYQIDAFGVKRAVLVEAANRSICTGCKEDCDTCSLKRAVERLAAYEDTELGAGTGQGRHRRQGAVSFVR